MIGISEGLMCGSLKIDDERNRDENDGQNSLGEFFQVETQAEPKQTHIEKYADGEYAVFVQIAL
jgi:hypothetical protein